MGRELTMYGLDHCSTCQKARTELTDAGWTVHFRDVQKQPLSEVERQGLVEGFDDKIINRASLTWRAMSETDRAAPPVEMLGKHPSVMKRPAIFAGDQRLRGWTANVKRALGAV